MNREETRKAAEVMLHYANGGEIECRTKSGGTNQWVAPRSYSWDWIEVEYRIKPNPVEVLAWAVVFEKPQRGMIVARSSAEAATIQTVHGGVIVELKGTYT